MDIGRENYDSRYERRLVAPEGFPNSYVRGASGLYLRVGVHIEAAEGSTGQAATAASQNAAAARGIHLHVVAEPVIPEGGVRCMTTSLCRSAISCNSQLRFVCLHLWYLVCFWRTRYSPCNRK